jgi:prepilin-type N-terminal cleavage/methylation domain-containing protein
LFCIITTKMNLRSSFTLIELLVVLAIVAILSVVVIVTLNPAELLRQSRDSNRLSDLSTLNSALGDYNVDVGGSMGNPNTIYVSIPDTSSVCVNLGLPTLPSGWNYGCVTATSTRRTDGTGWIPVNFQSITFSSPISALPTDPTNTTSSGMYYTYLTGGSWKLSAMSLEAQKNQSKTTQDGGVSDTSYETGNGLTLGTGIFPSGWIKVPGNGTFGTSDFYVMKYEAKCATAANPGVGLTAPDTGGQTYANNTTPCVGPTYTITSLPGGYPVANITQTTAITYCQNIGAHLITNNEWQTIAWNAEGVASNWSGAVVGSGNMGRGNYNTTNASVASADDSNGNYGVAADSLHKRTNTLSNGQVIWDLAGNVSEMTNDTIAGSNEPWAAPAGFTFREFANITNWGTMTQAMVGPVNTAWGTAQGVGRAYTDGSANATVYAVIRGGGFGGGYGSTFSGVEALDEDIIPSVSYPPQGFRCAR